MRAVDLIYKKRLGLELSPAEIDYLVSGYSRAEIPDYQMAAFLMAVCWRGMTRAETFALTDAMVRSGRRLDLSAFGVVADKHSTGGVGDKVSLVVVPLVAALGVPVAKMSGRGLGHTGGTLDKLESFPGLRVGLSEWEFLDQLSRIGLVIAGQSPELAPADARIYALRDATATVDSIPLIAASIMSKKLAAGAPVIVLDVKVGRGAFMRRRPGAERLARLLVDIGRTAGRKLQAVLTDMNQPLGRAVGNALEVKEAILTLRGEGPADLVEVCVEIAGWMLWLAGRYPDLEAARRAVRAVLAEGAALGKLAEMVAAQGGDPALVWEPDRLPAAPVRQTVAARQPGYVTRLDARAVGEAAVRLGAGRAKKGDPVDHRVGFIFHRKPGDWVSPGEPLFEVHARTKAEAEAAAAAVLNALTIGDRRPPGRPVVLGTVTAANLEPG
jgi:pyrimidine-nucleoside phosphorylase